MEVKINKLTNINELHKANSSTTGHTSIQNLTNAYKSEHSPIRTQIFFIEMLDIPTYVSVHFVRSKIGVEHFVKSNRSDRTSETGKVDRNTLINHSMLINAQALINLSLIRLCRKSDKRTIEVMEKIKQQMFLIDRSLAMFMVPKCVYRNGLCGEIKSCGFHMTLRDENNQYAYYNGLVNGVL